MTTGAIIAGGAARRMGGLPKGLLELDGEPVVARLRRVLAACCDHTLLVGDPAGPYAAPGLPVVPDVIPDRGAPGGVHAALSHAGEGWVFVAAVDLPWLDVPTIEALAATRDGHDVAVYRADGYLQPLAAWWHVRALPALDRLLRAGNPGFAAVFTALDVAVVEAPDPRPLRNVNTPAEAAEAGLRASDRG